MMDQRSAIAQAIADAAPSPITVGQSFAYADAAIAAYEATRPAVGDEEDVLPDGSAIWVKSRIKGVDPGTDFPYRIAVPSRWQPADAVCKRSDPHP